MPVTAATDRGALLANTRHGLFVLLAQRVDAWPEVVRARWRAHVEAKMTEGFPDRYRGAVERWARVAVVEEWLFGDIAHRGPVTRSGVPRPALAKWGWLAGLAHRMERDLSETLRVEREVRPRGLREAMTEVEAEEADAAGGESDGASVMSTPPGESASPGQGEGEFGGCVVATSDRRDTSDQIAPTTHPAGETPPSSGEDEGGTV